MPSFITSNIGELSHPKTQYTCSTTIHASPNYLLQPAASGSPRTPTSQSSSAARPAASATGGAAVNIVLWEDWPRKVEEKRDGSEEDR